VEIVHGGLATLTNTKEKMNDAERRTVGDPTCWSMPGKGASSKGRDANWREDPVVSVWATSASRELVASGCMTSSISREQGASGWAASVLRRLFACHICLALSKAEESRVFAFLHRRECFVYACGTVKVRPHIQS
jgi:hypothetical protein